MDINLLHFLTQIRDFKSDVNCDVVDRSPHIEVQRVAIKNGKSLFFLEPGATD